MGPKEGEWKREEEEEEKEEEEEEEEEVQAVHERKSVKADEEPEIGLNRFHILSTAITEHLKFELYLVQNLWAIQRNSGNKYKKIEALLFVLCAQNLTRPLFISRKIFSREN